MECIRFDANSFSKTVYANRPLRGVRAARHIGKLEWITHAESKPPAIPAHEPQSLAQSALHRVYDRLLVGELPRFQLRVDEIAVERDLEAPAAGGNQLQVLDLLLEGSQEIGRQTDGLGFVVSKRTVFDFDIHLDLPTLGTPLLYHHTEVRPCATTPARLPHCAFRRQSLDVP